MQMHVAYNFNSSAKSKTDKSDSCHMHCAALMDKNLVVVGNIKYT